MVHNRTRGPVRLLGKSLPRSTSMELDEKLLTENELTELRAAEAFKSICCVPSSLPKPVVVQIVRAAPPPQEAQVVRLAPRQNGKKARGGR